MRTALYNFGISALRCHVITTTIKRSTHFHPTCYCLAHDVRMPNTHGADEKHMMCGALITSQLVIKTSTTDR